MFFVGFARTFGMGIESDFVRVKGVKRLEVLHEAFELVMRTVGPGPEFYPRDSKNLFNFFRVN